MNTETKMKHIKAINRICERIELNILHNNKIPKYSHEYTIKNKETGETKRYKIVLAIMEVENK